MEKILELLHNALALDQAKTEKKKKKTKQLAIKEQHRHRLGNTFLL